MKILNLYAGIGGNRKLWGDEHEITAVEIDPKIAKIYQDFFPNDKVLVTDAHQYLLEYYKEFDFIWSSPPCPTHSTIINSYFNQKNKQAKYPEMVLYQEIILLTKWFKGRWCVENVISYYSPLIKPYECGRHYFWGNFIINNKKTKHPDIVRSDVNALQEYHGFDLSKFNIKNKRILLRNCVHPKLGLHIFKCAFKDKQEILK